MPKVLSNALQMAVRLLKHPILISSVLMTGAVLGARYTGTLQSLELQAYDQMLRMRPPLSGDSRLLIVEITEEDIRNQRQWPLSDQTVADLLAQLQRSRPRVIGLDIYRDIPNAPGTADLQQELQANNVVVIQRLSDENGQEVPPPAVVPDERVGFSDFVLDSDSVIRRNLLFATNKPDEFYSLGLRLSLLYLSDRNLDFRTTENSLWIGDTEFPALNLYSGGYWQLDYLGYQVMLRYRSPDHLAPRVTLTQVLQNQVDPALIENKLVLIGTTAESAKDLFVTPFNRAQGNKPSTPGVLIHAQITSQILHTVLDGQPLIWYWPEGAEMLWVWAWSLVGGAIAWRLWHPFAATTGILLAGGLLTSTCYVIFLNAGWVPVVPPAIALVAAGVSVFGFRLLHAAFHDTLTQLPNRLLFARQIQTAITQRQRLYTNKPENADLKPPAIAVLLLGLDSFKAINDSYGHAVGDQLLIATAERLQACLNDTDQLARVGGDEFAILRSGITDPEEIIHLADILQGRMAAPFQIHNRDIYTTVSVGIALDQLGSNCEPEEILGDAHTAMNRAKDSGKARHELFVTGMRTQLMARLQLETDLRHAVERQEFELYYQPIVALQTGKIAGFEALIRWHHPQRGFMPPSEFIPIAEESNLIIPLSRWIIWEACEQMCRWHVKYHTDPPYLVSINLSVKQFSQPDFVEQIEQCLQETKLDPHSLKLEITESMAMNDVESTIALLQRLKSLGLQLSIDDFGTGYSSLSYLHRFPTNTIKVDRSFVSHMGEQTEDAHIVQTIIILGHNLGMDIVAEGVETAEQLAKLRELGCEYAQGYFFSKPVPVDAMEKLLQSDPQW